MMPLFPFSPISARKFDMLPLFRHAAAAPSRLLIPRPAVKRQSSPVAARAENDSFHREFFDLMLQDSCAATSLAAPARPRRGHYTVFEVCFMGKIFTQVAPR